MERRFCRCCPTSCSSSWFLLTFFPFLSSSSSSGRPSVSAWRRCRSGSHASCDTLTAASDGLAAQAGRRSEHGWRQPCLPPAAPHLCSGMAAAAGCPALAPAACPTAPISVGVATVFCAVASRQAPLAMPYSVARRTFTRRGSAWWRHSPLTPWHALRVFIPVQTAAPPHATNSKM
jgi:hypothetical protein